MDSARRKKPPWHAVLAVITACAALPAATPAPEAEVFFETKIRPLLVDNCFECHGPGKQMNGLRVDSLASLLTGGERGPALKPGDPAGSLLVKAVQYETRKLKMPPQGKLDDVAIAQVIAWVQMGAPWPTRAGSDPNRRAWQDHWSFLPLEVPAGTPDGAAGIDHLVADGLRQAQLEPSPEADRRTLLRRLSYDLTGLPPSPDEVAAFLADQAPDAYERQVDRLLASPAFGERWGRYWLDVARYADSKGYVFQEDRNYPYSYTYRDWVIDAFNRDLPYDQFIKLQLAADQLAGDRTGDLAAMGFLTVGRRFLNNAQDIIDDRIDVTTRGLMGLTVACARCHDHKYDPIPTADYYSLYGVFASSREPDELPRIGDAADPAEQAKFKAEMAKLAEDLETIQRTVFDQNLAEARRQVGEYLLAAREVGADDAKVGAVARDRRLTAHLVRRWAEAVQRWETTPEPAFAPWLALADLPAEGFATGAAQALSKLDAATADPLILAALREPAPASIEQAAERYGALFKAIEESWQALRETDPQASSLPEAGREHLRQVLLRDGAPTAVPYDQAGALLQRDDVNRIRGQQQRMDNLEATHPGAPPRAMVMVDNEFPTDPVIFERGNPGRRGDPVPRQFLMALDGATRQPFTQGSGRRELAERIASPDNPLTARVWANRVWSHLFGSPLVDTPSDFGMRSRRPDNPALLDHLAATLQAHGWSSKALLREVVLSRTYRQNSAHGAAGQHADPENRMYWRQNRRRLDFEAMRDTLLAASGRLDPKMGGRAVDIVGAQPSPRRTVYGFIDRQNLPGLFRTFDFASPDGHSPQRFYTTVPQQALFLLNSPFTIDQARAVAARPEIAALADPRERIRGLYRLLFAREPEARELALGTAFVTEAEVASPEPEAGSRDQWTYAWGTYDDAAGTVTDLRPLPHFTGQAWQGGPKLPDDKLGWVTLNARGGHPGNDHQHAAVRVWTSPGDGTVNLTGDLRNGSSEGDGVLATLVSSRHGRLGRWLVNGESTATRVDKIPVLAGDTLCLVVDNHGNSGFDSFDWPVELKVIEGFFEAPIKNWSSQADFAGPRDAAPEPLNPWEQYAQVLLMTNELLFVD